MSNLSDNTVQTEIENTIGYRLAMSFKPFINPKCTEHMEIVKDFAKSINNVMQKQAEIISVLAALGPQGEISVVKNVHKINLMISKAKAITV